MLLFLFWTFSIFFPAVVSTEHHFDRKITVAIPTRNSIAVLDRNAIPRGLDVLIVENFAQKFDLQIDYIVINSSLDRVLSNEYGCDALLLRYVLIDFFFSLSLSFMIKYLKYLSHE